MKKKTKYILGDEPPNILFGEEPPKAEPPKTVPPPKEAGAPNPLLGLLLKPPNEPNPPLVGEPKLE